MKLKLEMDLGNAAFAVEADDDRSGAEFNGDEIARILRTAAAQIAEHYGNVRPGHNARLWDVNGNDVGDWEIVRD